MTTNRSVQIIQNYNDIAIKYRTLLEVHRVETEKSILISLKEELAKIVEKTTIYMPPL
jgi:hypothetical protein